ncbi:PAS domain S-box-containing protein/diguanylate cyclase (GGDEF)-like protein [Trichococcus patagoniensis]|uniref:PAS domain S-box-containing protein/diguanylate cyclase (GGDEF)-like protein n=1 Tax=Trichococcus patagoniensis TaxID=382641 RepID=A0A2T5IQ95_9LACT|nr:sensor domain-containing diguanylate cyclase [Trichococcus patagoniensis]PTQ85997.1 PAS domain S-box-containing protein/diguanylate cyclase (GGDEF)-like protein [Trichococcus patagoniensis]
MDTNDLVQQKLMAEIAYLQRLNKELINQIYEDDFSKFPWLGNLGQWFWDYPKNMVTFNPLKASALGYSHDEIPAETGFEFFTEKLHPEDYAAVMDEMRAHLKGLVPVWEVKYRIQAKDGSWKVFYDRGKVTQWSDDHKPLFLVGNVFDVTDDENQKRELIQKSAFWRAQAQIDSLTKLYTRAALEEKLSTIHQHSLQNQKNYSILLLDIDHFKNINDTYGHLVGDQVLNKVGAILSSNVREADIVARYGGEEFLIVFPNLESEDAKQIGERMQENLKNTELPIDSSLTFSAGIASNIEIQDIKELLELADVRLYRAKNTGRNRIVEA